MKIEWLHHATRFEIDDWTKQYFKRIYPFFDRELIKMEVWVVTNWTVNGKPGKSRKKNWARFMTNWLNRVKETEPVTKPVRDYKKEEKEFREKMEKAVKEAAPPPDDWRALMNKLKPKGV